jgi:hypothetical protein
MMESRTGRLNRRQVQTFRQLDHQMVGRVFQQVGVDTVTEPVQERRQMGGDEGQNKVGYNRHGGLRS